MSELDPIMVDGMPSAQGLWERCFLLETLQANNYELLYRFPTYYGAVDLQTTRNVVALWEPTWSTFRMGTTYYVLVQGTESVMQALLHCSGVAYTESLTPQTIVNSQWWKVANAFWDEIKGECNPDSGIERVDLCGHSYGGAVAGLLGLRVKQDFPALPVSVATFGSPRARGGFWDQTFPETWVQARNRNDVVPNLPPADLTVTFRGLVGSFFGKRSASAQWMHDGRPVLLDGDGFFQVGFDEPAISRQAFASGPTAWETAHWIMSYRTNLQGFPGLVIPPLDIPPEQYWQQKNAEATPAPLTPDTSVSGWYDRVNRLFWSEDSGPITPANVTSWETTALSASVAGVRPPANKGVFQGAATMAVASNFTRVTFCINDGTYGRTESHVANRTITEPALLDQIYALASARSILLGATRADFTNKLKGPGQPIIEFIKLTDAVQPKIGRLLKVKNFGYVGPPMTPNFPSDPMYSALSTRLVARLSANVPTSGGEDGRTVNTTVQLNGICDASIVGTVFDGDFQRGTPNYWTQLRRYLLTLISTTGPGWGCIGLSSLETKKAIQSVLPVVGPPFQWQFTVPTAAYSSGDRVRITDANPVFNGTWEIVKNVNATYSLKNQPVSGHTAPSTGFMQRVATADKVKSMGWYRYESFQPDGSFPDYPQVSVSKKNPGRQFLGVSFRSRKRRER